MSTYESLAGEVLFAGKTGILRKLVCSKPEEEGVLRATGRVCQLHGALYLQLETFHTDGKATHVNLPMDDTLPAALAERLTGFSQLNLLTDAGDVELRRNKKGNTVLLGAEKLHKSRLLTPPVRREVAGNNKTKNRILTGGEPFLRLLGVSDENGRVYDKKGAKFRQINRFLELTRDTLPHLPEKKIRICDLCCGKSYLSFAVYHYFANILGMRCP